MVALLGSATRLFYAHARHMSDREQDFLSLRKKPLCIVIASDYWGQYVEQDSVGVFNAHSYILVGQSW